MNDTELKIYNAAKEHFYKNGYYNTTVREIAKSAEVNSGLFNYYFQNKYNIAKMMYDDIFYNIKNLTLQYFNDEKNPAIFMGVMMRLHTYTLYSDPIVKFVMDALKEGIFEDSIFYTTEILVKNIADYYKRNYTDEALHLLLSITIATEKTCLTQKYNGRISYDLHQIANTILKIHLSGFDLDKDEIARCTESIVEKFEFITSKHPNFVDLII
ncbi:TetR/AcrR family transcriptional regulator [Anaeromicrobium sediminis]|uniref:HTH tetR-type domain-containing protein n=1 Tax=Anaeromicrobium sediminis TaxID=1478221 RepID=A0A267MLT6_9FIRM|nr:TetR/AcrR family transcriptional regulator [Anaeromicrobium sediminis]PAB60561.1 hypothetical protein CCE28_03180 [Anaeromicrobium sediminis]